MIVSSKQALAHQPRSIRLVGVLALVSALLVVGCSSKKPSVEKSAALTGAERLEHRASSAYIKGDLAGARKDFLTAGQVYSSLALVDAAASVQLSLARIDLDEGRAKEAQARIDQVLGQATQGSEAILPATLLLANGRAAALYLQQKNIPAADIRLTAAERLCGNSCDSLSALQSLRSNWLLASNDASSGQTKAGAALAAATSPADKANALRSLAESGLALKQTTQAIAYAEQALQLDQQLGASLRVIADLDLLARIHGKVGAADKAATYAAQAQLASSAHQQLGGK